MAAVIKMDELLVSWLGSDTVYEEVLTRIESYRLHNVVGSPTGESTSEEKKEFGYEEDGTEHTDDTLPPPQVQQQPQLQKPRGIPPFYRPPGTLNEDGTRIPSLRRTIPNGSEQNQSWDGGSSSSSHDPSTTTDPTASSTSNKDNTNQPSSSPSSPSEQPKGLSIPPSSTLPPSPPLSINEQVKAVYHELGSDLPNPPISSSSDDNATSSSKHHEQSNLLDSRYLTTDNFVRLTRDICGFPTFFNRPLYKRILFLWNSRENDEKKALWEVYYGNEGGGGGGGEGLVDGVLGVSPPSSSSSDAVGDGGSNSSNNENQDHPTETTTTTTPTTTTTNNNNEEETETLQHRHKLIHKAGGDVLVTFRIFRWFWFMEMEDYDPSERFYRLLKKWDREFIRREDFSPYIKELLRDHPGLEFLSDHAEFQDKYAVTVITRIFYCVDRSHSGRITARQIRRSDLLSAFQQVDEEEDINKVSRYFSYEHFYVLYCRFWELDHDRDYRIVRDDLLKYGDQCLSHMIVDRIFDAAPRPFDGGVGGDAIANTKEKDGGGGGGKSSDRSVATTSSPRDYLTYEDFIFFMLSEEDKSNEISVRYWFACLDVDGDGKLNNMEMRSFYALQQHRMQALGHENIPFEDMLCQMIDMIKPECEEYLVPEDFLQPECHQVSGSLFDALFNINKYVQFEQRDPFQERQKREDEFESDWDRFACMDYNRLAMEEEAREEDGMEIDWVTVDEDDDEGGEGGEDNQDEDGFAINGGLGVASEAPF